MEPIFAGKLSLTDDIPDRPVFERASESKLDQLRATAKSFLPRDNAILWSKALTDQTKWTSGYIQDTYGQPQPLPESGLSPAAQRVRAEAIRLGIDYDKEVTRTLLRMHDSGMTIAPGPYNRTAGKDPLANVTPEARDQAERATAELLKRMHGVQA